MATKAEPVVLPGRRCGMLRAVASRGCPVRAPGGGSDGEHFLSPLATVSAQGVQLLQVSRPHVRP